MDSSKYHLNADLKAGSGLLLLGLLEVLRVVVEEEVDRDGPRLSAGDGAAHAENLTGEEPVAEADGELSLVVGRDGDVDILKRGVRVAESDDRDIDVTSLADTLGVGPGVGDDEDTGLPELLGDLVGEGSGGDASSDGSASGVLGELEDGPLSVRAGRDDLNISSLSDVEMRMS
jgi:hypothetical protein